MSKRKGGLIKKLLAVGLVIFVGVPLLAMMAGYNPPPNQQDEKQASGNKTDKSSAAPRAKTIPGLLPADVYLNLEKRGYKVERTGRSFPRWVCKLNKGDYIAKVDIHSEDASSVSSISATFTNLSDQSKTNDLAGTVLGYIATIPYKNARPEEAKHWIEQHISQTAETVINGVKFQIIANSDAPRVRILRITVAE